MESPFISVIIDTYNYGRFIEEAIDSVLLQNFPAERLEVIVADDGSTDDTAERIAKYGSKIRYLKKENGGQASAFNFGFAHTRGDIVCFLDADDYWLPDKFARLVEVFSDSAVGIVTNDYELSNPDSNGNTKSNLALVSGDLSGSLESLLRYCIFPTSCLSFRRETLERLLPVPEAIKLQADAYLALLAAFVAPVVALPDILTIYRIHGANLYSADASPDYRARKRNSNAMRRVILGAMDSWFRNNGFNVRDGIVHTFMEVLTVQQERMEFSVDPPTRVQLFSHMLHYNHTYRNLQSWKLTVLNYFLAIVALVSGHEMQNSPRLSNASGPHV